MDHIKIFLASSIYEFNQERESLCSFVQRLNEILIDIGLFVRIFICENASQAIAPAGASKQDEYDDQVRSADYVYFIIGQRAGKYTQGEFDVALKQNRESGGRPKVYVYYAESEKREESAKAFMERVNNDLNHYPTEYIHLESLKLDMLLELTRDYAAVIKVEDAKVMVNDKDVGVDLSAIPLYSKNASVQQMLKKKQEMDTDYADLAADYNRAPTAAKLRSMNRLSKEREEAVAQLHKMEMDTLSLRQYALSVQGKKIDPREKAALDAIENGDYETAKAILKDELWDKEIEDAQETVDAALEPIRQRISAKRTLIRAIGATGMTAQAAAEILAVYEELIPLCEKYQLELNILTDYAIFLFDKCESFEESYRIAARAKQWFEIAGDKESQAVALGIMADSAVGMGKIDAAQDLYISAFNLSFEGENFKNKKEQIGYGRMLIDILCYKGDFCEAEHIWIKLNELVENFIRESAFLPAALQDQLLHAKATIMEGKGEYSSAEEIYWDIIAREKNPSVLLSLYIDLYRILSEQNKEEIAYQVLEKGLLLAEELCEGDRLEVDSYARLIELYSDKVKSREEFEKFNFYVARCEKILDELSEIWPARARNSQAAMWNSMASARYQIGDEEAALRICEEGQRRILEWGADTHQLALEIENLRTMQELARQKILMRELRQIRSQMRELITRAEGIVAQEEEYEKKDKSLPSYLKKEFEDLVRKVSALRERAKQIILKMKEM